jgi:hypothetical protein
MTDHKSISDDQVNVHTARAAILVLTSCSLGRTVRPLSPETLLDFYLVEAVQRSQ